MRALLIALLVALAAGAPAARPDPGFDLLLLVRSYSPGFCQESNCSVAPV